MPNIAVNRFGREIGAFLKSFCGARSRQLNAKPLGGGPSDLLYLSGSFSRCDACLFRLFGSSWRMPLVTVWLVLAHASLGCFGRLGVCLTRLFRSPWRMPRSAASVVGAHASLGSFSHRGTCLARQLQSSGRMPHSVASVVGAHASLGSFGRLGACLTRQFQSSGRWRGRRPTGACS